MRVHKVLIGSALALTATASAQKSDRPLSVPIEFAESPELDITGQLTKSPSYYLGRLSPGWPSELVPVKANVVGSMTRNVFGELEQRLAVFTVPSSRDAEAAFGRQLMKAGFKSREMVAPQEGFLPSAPAPGQRGWCRNDQYVTLGVSDTARRRVVVSLIGGEAATRMCDANWMLKFTRHGGEWGLTLPALTPPRGSTGGAMSGSSGGGDSGHISASLVTTMSADSVVMHYTGQLVAAGWKAEERPALGTGVAVQRFTVTQKGRAWRAAFMVLTVGERKDLLVRYVAVEETR